MLHRIACLTLVTAMLSACATPGAKGDLLENTLQSYAAVIRWGNFEDAVSFVDPATLQAHPLTQLDLQRYGQVRVSGYNEQPRRATGDGKEVQQTVEITLANNNTQTVRSFLDRQVWRYDEKAKRWWLVTGLPDITQH
jgi:hypothetical protein